MPNLHVAVAAFFVALLLPLTGNAQRGTAGLASESRAPIVRLTDSNARPVVIRSVSIDTEIVGREARSRIELRIGNPNPRTLEGELQFPLLDGQVISGFALDVHGRLRDAVAVPKARGQEIFEDIRRRQVDPALLEVTASNQYKLRVYPIPAHGERGVVLWVSERLEVARGRALWRMPLVYSNELERLSLSVVAMGLKQQEVAIRSAPQGTALFAKPDRVVVELKGNRWASASARDIFIAIDIAIPNRDRLLVGETEGRRYAVADIPFVDEPVRRIEPKHIALIWDASASAKSQTRAIGVLDSFFARLTGTAKVTLLVVRNQVDLVESFAVDRRSWDALRRQIEREPFDGSSNFDQLAIPETVDLAVLVSDGLATDGERRIGYTHRAPLVALNAALVADAPRLRRLAERTGGRYVDLGVRSLGDAADEIWRDGWRVERVTGSGIEQHAMPSARAENGEFRIAGVVTEASAHLELHLVHPTRGQKTLSRRLDISTSTHPNRLSSRWPGQLWANWHIASLADEPQINASAMQRIAAQHGIVGPTSSLIVLETADDYVRYDLPAPAELRDAVAKLAATARASAQTTRATHIERLVREFELRQRWWERSFPKDLPPANAEKKATAGAIVDVSPALSPEPPSAAAMPSSPIAQRRAVPSQREAPFESNAMENTERTVDSRSPTRASIALQAWSSNAPYLRRLREARETDLYRVYLDLRDDHAASSAFYLDVASLFFERKQHKFALRILSNLAEMNLENRQLLRLYGYRLCEAKEFVRATSVFARVLELAPDEPQSLRDLGLAYADSGQAQKALDTLWEAASRPKYQRFAGVNMIALAEMNAVIAASPAVDTSRIDRRLIRAMPLGLRVVMAWDTDDTDVDLWVTDPNGERSFYGKRLSYQGGAMSPDATGGYGPEEFALRDPKAGVYTVHAQFYGHRQQVVSNGTTVMVRVTKDFATAHAKDEWLTLRLTDGRETVRVGEIEVLSP